MPGVANSLASTLPRSSSAGLPQLPDGLVLDSLRHSQGRYGTTLNDLLETATALEANGIADQDVERLAALARWQGLVPRRGRGCPGAMRTDAPTGSSSAQRGQHRSSGGKIAFGVNVEQHTRIIGLDTDRWVAREQSTRSLVSGQ